MARLKNGINGSFSGKVGSVVGSNWKGIDYIRGLPKKRTDEPQSGEKNNRTKFGFAQRWLSLLQPFIAIGLMNYSDRMTAHNAALSWALKNAVKGGAPDFYMDYASVMLSDGILLPVTEPAINVSDDNLISIQWTSDFSKKANSNDELLFAAYCPDLENAFFSLGSGIRSSKQVEISVPEHFQGHLLEIYIGFVSIDRKHASRSQYLGSVQTY